MHSLLIIYQSFHFSPYAFDSAYSITYANVLLNALLKSRAVSSTLALVISAYRHRHAIASIAAPSLQTTSFVSVIPSIINIGVFECFIFRIRLPKDTIFWTGIQILGKRLHLLFER